MSVCIVHPGSLKYGFAGITMKGAITDISIKFLNLNIIFLDLNIRM